MRIPLWTAWRERREWKLNAATSVLANAGIQIATAAGVSVTEKKALQYVPVLACARVLAEDVASLPLITYRRLAPRGKERATEHPLYQLLHTQPNPEQDAFMFRSMLQMHAATWGGGYAEIETADGWPVALWPIPAWRIEPRRLSATGELFYHVTWPSINEQGRYQGVDLAREQVFRVFWLTLDGVTPISPVGFAREAIGLGLATQEFGARFFSNDARPSMVLEHPGPTLSDVAAKRMVGTFEQRHRGLSRSHRIALLEEGTKVHEIGVPPEDAQFLETRNFQAEDIARLYRMPQHKIGLLSHATFTNIEHQGIEYVVDALRPWLVRWEQAILTQLVPREQRTDIFAEFLVDALLRGDTPSRYEAYAKAINSGWMSRNDVRVLENMNPVEGLDEYLVPLNMVVATGPAPAPPAGRAEQRSVAGRRRLAGAYHGLFVKAAERIVRREKADIMKLAEEQLRSRNGTFAEGLDKFFTKHEEFVRREMGPVLLSYAEAIHAEANGDVRADEGLPPELEVFMAAYLTGFVDRWIGSSRGQVLGVTGAALSRTEALASLGDRFTEWLATRPEKTAAWETAQAGNAVTKETYRLAGVERLVWVASGNACPYCQSLDGRVVEITKNFINAGDPLEADGADGPLTTTVDIGHPPAHAGCSCSVMPAA